VRASRQRPRTARELVRGWASSARERVTEQESEVSVVEKEDEARARKRKGKGAEEEAAEEARISSEKGRWDKIKKGVSLAALMAVVIGMAVVIVVVRVMVARRQVEML